MSNPPEMNTQNKVEANLEGRTFPPYYKEMGLSPELAEITLVAETAASKSGVLLKATFDAVNRGETTIDVTMSGLTKEEDLQTRTDLASQEIIIQEIQAAFSNQKGQLICGILTEETPVNAISRTRTPEEERLLDGFKCYLMGPENAKDLWIVDPLDGTTNFTSYDTNYGIQLAYMQDGEVTAGLTYRPSTGDWFYAAKGHGAWHRSEGDTHVSKMSVSGATDIEQSRAIFEAKLGRIGPVVHEARVKGIDKWRVWGAAVADFPAVARGSRDFLVAFGPTPYDIAPGCLLVEEAGGKATDKAGDPWTPFSKTLVLSNGALHSRVLDIANKPTT